VRGYRSQCLACSSLPVRDEADAAATCFWFLLRVVSLGALTQVKKKGRAVKESLVTRIRDAVNTYSHIYVFDVSNRHRNCPLLRAPADISSECKRHNESSCSILTFVCSMCN
jgi:hypothetical protein